MVEFVGWLSGILFAISAAPEVYRSWKAKQCFVGWGMLSIWFSGEVLAVVYILNKGGFWDFLPLLFNYLSNIVFLAILLYYKITIKQEVFISN